MGPHRLKKGAVCCDDRARAHGDGERQVERVVGRMVYDDTDLQRQVMEAHTRSWGRFDLRAEQGQPLPSFVRREQFSAHLQPQDIGRFVQPKSLGQAGPARYERVPLPDGCRAPAESI